MEAPNFDNLRTILEQAVHLHQSGNIKDAEGLYQKVLAADPNQPDALHLLGVIKHQAGQHKEAVKLFERALAVMPDEPKFHLNIGLAYKEMANWDAAINHYRRSIELDDSSVDAHRYLGNVYKKTEQYHDALKSYQNALKLNSELGDVWLQAGLCFHELEDYEQALGCVNNALKQKPEDTKAKLAKARILVQLGEYEPAKSLCESLLQQLPEDLNVLEVYARALHRMRDSVTAINIFKKLIKLNPDDPHLYHNLAVLNAETGFVDEATEMLEAAIARDPSFAQAHFTFSQVKKFKKNDPEITIIKQLLEDEKVPKEDKIELHYAIGKMYADCKKYDESFSHFLKGSQLKPSRFDINNRKKFFSELKSIFTLDFLTKMHKLSQCEESPIFIVGMPRSGTTLVEQIISAHPMVAAGGELLTMGHIANGLKDTVDKSLRYPQIMKKITAQHISEMSKYYLDDTKAFKQLKRAKMVTDKMPYNYIHLGLISLLFPKAKIIHTRRDPLDTCVSIFTQHFKQPQIIGNRLEEIGKSYNLYLDLMTHWENTLPVRVYDIQYETLVSRQKNEIKNLIEFCGLTWDDACLKFYESKGYVRTASLWQVRQPIYKHSIGRWKHYKKYLSSLRDIIDNHIIDS